MQKVTSCRVFAAKRKGTCCSKKSKKVKVKQNEFKKKEIKKIKRSNKKGNEKRGECETWWTKTRSDGKRMKEELKKKKTERKDEHAKTF